MSTIHQDIQQHSKINSSITILFIIIKFNNKKKSISISTDINEEDILKIITEIHNESNAKIVFFISGGAGNLAKWILCPGSSNTVIEILYLYAQQSLMQMANISNELKSVCSKEASIIMAKHAYKRASLLTNNNEKIIGISVTCALASLKPKKGPHRCHICNYKLVNILVIFLKNRLL